MTDNNSDNKRESAKSQDRLHIEKILSQAVSEINKKQNDRFDEQRKLTNLAIEGQKDLLALNSDFAEKLSAAALLINELKEAEAKARQEAQEAGARAEKQAQDAAEREKSFLAILTSMGEQLKSSQELIVSINEQSSARFVTYEKNQAALAETILSVAQSVEGVSEQLGQTNSQMGQMGEHMNDKMGQISGQIESMLPIINIADGIGVQVSNLNQRMHSNESIIKQGFAQAQADRLEIARLQWEQMSEFMESLASLPAKFGTVLTDIQRSTRLMQDAVGDIIKETMMNLDRIRTIANGASGKLERELDYAISGIQSSLSVVMENYSKETAKATHEQISQIFKMFEGVDTSSFDDLIEKFTEIKDYLEETTATYTETVAGMTAIKKEMFEEANKLTNNVVHINTLAENTNKVSEQNLEASRKLHLAHTEISNITNIVADSMTPILESVMSDVTDKFLSSTKDIIDSAKDDINSHITKESTSSFNKMFDSDPE